uniref:30S ribosomal protein S18 n=1 Tax=Strongyloides stercoralis TaxID=6248 RepID=A0A0K0ELB7_STRER
MLSNSNYLLQTLSAPFKREGRAASVGHCFEYANKYLTDSDKLSTVSTKSGKRYSPNMMRRRSMRTQILSAERKLHLAEWSNQR